MLVQIRKTYIACWNDITLSVQNDVGQWTLEVRDATRRERLYQAHRSSARAAQAAAADFLWLQAPGVTPQVTWQECW